MAKLYWTKDIKKAFDDKINELLNSLIDDRDGDQQTEMYTLEMIRVCKRFAKDVISDLKEADRLDDEQEARRKAEGNDATGSD